MMLTLTSIHTYSYPASLNPSDAMRSAISLIRRSLKMKYEKYDVISCVNDVITVGYDVCDTASNVFWLILINKMKQICMTSYHV